MRSIREEELIAKNSSEIKEAVNVSVSKAIAYILIYKHGRHLVVNFVKS